jgi:hypothetical protein
MTLSNADYKKSVILEWIWNNGRMILTGKNWRMWRKTCLTAALSTANTTRTGLKFKLGHHGTKRYNTLFSFWKLILSIILWFGSYSYLCKACISIIHLYDVKVAHTNTNILDNITIKSEIRIASISSGKITN